MVYQLIIRICPRLAAISVDKYKATGKRQGKNYLIDGHVNTPALPFDIFTSSSSSGSTASGSPQTPASSTDLNLDDHLDGYLHRLDHLADDLHRHLRARATTEDPKFARRRPRRVGVRCTARAPRPPRT